MFKAGTGRSSCWLRGSCPRRGAGARRGGSQGRQGSQTFARTLRGCAEFVPTLRRITTLRNMNKISKIRVANTQRTVSAKVHTCEFEDFVYWQREIHQPYLATGGGIGSDWNWPRLFLACTMAEKLARRKCLGIQVRVEAPSGDAFPVAQAILSYPFAWAGNKMHKSVFLWFVAAAPKAALIANGIFDRFSTLPVVLDTAVQLSWRVGLSGRVTLHAASGVSTQENEKLAEKYRNYGLRQKFKTSTFFRFPFRRDDGRFFYFDSAESIVFARKQDDLR